MTFHIRPGVRVLRDRCHARQTAGRWSVDCGNSSLVSSRLKGSSKEAALALAFPKLPCRLNPTCGRHARTDANEPRADLTPRVGAVRAGTDDWARSPHATRLNSDLGSHALQRITESHQFFALGRYGAPLFIVGMFIITRHPANSMGAGSRLSRSRTPRAKRVVCWADAAGQSGGELLRRS
jgi:hypothetical protein